MHLRLLRYAPLANASPNKATRDLAVEERAIQQPVEYHAGGSADVVAAEVVRSPTVKGTRLTAGQEM